MIEEKSSDFLEIKQFISIAREGSQSGLKTVSKP